MKILAIRGSNLASLAGEFELPLSQGPLARAGLFAITGPTGAGKSTLLDAMCLALFSKTPRYGGHGGIEIGQEGEENKLRANDARNLVRRGTSVGWAEVEFLGQDDKRYRARWTARRARDRVDGRFQAQEWRLCEADTDRTIGGSGKEDTLREIEARLGLTYDQFRRSALLAQGDFAAFLKAAANERAELLEKVTGTEIYTEISVAAHKKNAECVQRVRDYEKRSEGVTVLSEAEREALGLQLVSREAAAAAAEAQCRQLEGAQRWYGDLAKLQVQEQEAQVALELAMRTFEGTKGLTEELTRVRAVEPFRAPVLRLDELGRAIEEARSALELHTVSLSLAEKTRQQLEVAANEAATAVTTAEANLVAARPQIVRAQQLDVQIKTAKQLADESRASADLTRQAAAAQVASSNLLARNVADIRMALANAESWLAEHAEFKALAKRQGRWQKTVEDYGRTHAETAARAKERKKLEKLEAKSAEALAESRRLEQTLREALTSLERELAKALVSDPAVERSALRARRTLLAEQHELAQKFSDLAREAQRLERELADASAAALRQDLDGQEAQARREKALTELVTVRTQYEEAKRALEHENSTRELSQLRASLADDEECPLCGSLEHPYVHKAPGTKKQSAQAKRVKELEARQLTLVRLEAEAGSQLEQCRQTGEQARLKAAELGKTIKTHQAKWKKAVAGQKHFELSALAREVDLAVLESRAHQVTGDLVMLDKQERALDLSEKALKALQVRRDGAHLELEKATAAGRDFERKAEAARRDREENARDGDKLSALQQRHLTELKKEFSARPSWLVALEAAPAKFLALALGELAGWERYADEAKTLGASLATGVVEAKAAAHAAEEKDKQAGAEEAVALGRATELANLLAARQLLLEGKDVAVVEQTLTASEKAARLAHEAAKTELTQAIAAVAASQATETAREGTLAKTVADQAAQAAAVEASLATMHTDLAAVRELLARGAEWVAATEKQCLDVQTALTRAETTAKERQLQRQAHEATPAPAATAGEIVVLLSEASGNHERCREELSESKRQLANDDDARKAHAEYLTVLEALRLEVRPWEDLNKLIGSADGKAFRTFAQGLTLEMLLDLANEHLRDLAPRYRLMKVPMQDLEIQVKDLDMGEEIRGTQSLSGGETFLVSLGLALGLSSFAAKSTRIRSLFIDEGFGSLDAQTLEVALASLDALQASGRQVGIISHVPGLGDRLGVQVAVSPAGSGRSTVVIRSGAGGELVSVVPAAVPGKVPASL